ncbi:hypothetical protein BGW38_003063 [Lunasporangiospora selenospora]|uniref:Uncharacterized protein n=1 Tax=Lunasporangiospora selenospora TaxID=979761 RepID=A0A9P6KCY4_9FUNG|nr:hypothetical protein BGW38_003063 [Lunasporangiospora selenospora]
MAEKRWVLWIYVFVLLIAIALQITVGAIAFVYRNQAAEVLGNAWDRVYHSDPRVILDLESFLVSLLGAAVLFHRFDKRQYISERQESEESLLRALVEAHRVEGQIEEARRARRLEREIGNLASQVREDTRNLLRVEQEEQARLRDTERSRDPPPYGTFDPNPPRSKDRRR